LAGEKPANRHSVQLRELDRFAHAYSALPVLDVAEIVRVIPSDQFRRALL
jgi:hypothetical protein